MPDIWMDVDTALSGVPVNIMPLVSEADFISRVGTVTFNLSGLELIWHFTTTAGVTTATPVIPTSGGVYDLVHKDGAMYTIEIPASGGASINNDTEGFGWFTGAIPGVVLPWRGPTIGFRAAGLNNALIDSAYSTTRGLAGTALPDAAADAAGGLIISDAGGLDADAQLVTKINDILVDTGTTLQGELDGIQADTEDIQSRLPAALVGGRIDASVGAMAANVMTAAAAAADLTTELQSGLATASALADVQTDTNDIQTRLPAALVGGRVDASVGAMAANVMTAAAAAADLTTELQSGLATAVALATLQTTADAVKTKTDQLTFGVANVLNGNITHVNEIEVIGAGTTASAWRPTGS